MASWPKPSRNVSADPVASGCGQAATIHGSLAVPVPVSHVASTPGTTPRAAAIAAGRLATGIAPVAPAVPAASLKLPPVAVVEIACRGSCVSSPLRYPSARFV